jgi:DNA-binding NarL/FixJ family response regulator
VGAGRAYLSPEATEFVLATIATRRPPESAPQLAALSDRERHVLRLVGQGLSTREIATELELSIKTVETHYAHIKRKLGLRNSRELTRAGATLTERLDL